MQISEGMGTLSNPRVFFVITPIICQCFEFNECHLIRCALSILVKKKQTLNA